MLSVLLVSSAGSAGTLSASAQELTNDSIRQKEEEIKKAKEEKNSLQSSLSNVKEIKKQLETSKNNLANYITELDANLSTIQAKLEEAVAVQEAQYEAMKARIKFMYEKGDTVYLELLFAADSFGEVLNKAEYIEMLSSYDRKKLDEYVAQAEYVSLCKESLEEEKSVLDEARRVQEEEEASMNALISAKEQEISNVTSDIKNKEAAIAEYEADIAAQNQTIAALEKAVAEERARLAEEQGRRYDGGVFTWPAPSYTRISDDYGNRIHPTLGIQKFHNGIDMAAPGGSAILAAYDGKVVAADYNSSMGNYIMIDHGDSLYTIYMHASALYVSKGTEVSKGQKIAAVGTTGRSTGNHLHFSVRKGGSYVNPWSYLKG
mgnify:CR=1 FL=1